MLRGSKNKEVYRSIFFGPIYLSTGILMIGCSTIQQAYEDFNSQSNTKKGALIGGATGAVVGAALGSQIGSPAGGMLAGAAIGGGMGATIGHAIDKQNQQIEETEYSRQIKEYETLRQKEIYEGLELGSRRERVAPGDLYFSKINFQSQRSDNSTRNLASISNTIQTSPASMIESSAKASSSQISSEVSSTKQKLEPEDQAILSINPYKDEKQQPLKTGKEVTESNSQAKKIEPDLTIENNSTVESKASPENIKTASNSSPDSKIEVAATGNVNSAKSELVSISPGALEACPEGAEELKKASEAAELSAKLFHTRRSIRLCSNFTPGRLALAKLYIELKRFEDARFELENILKLEPSNSEAKTLLNSLPTN